VAHASAVQLHSPDSLHALAFPWRPVEGFIEGCSEFHYEDRK